MLLVGVGPPERVEREPYRCDGRKEVLEPLDGYMRKAIQLVNARSLYGKRRLEWPVGWQMLMSL